MDFEVSVWPGSRLHAIAPALLSLSLLLYPMLTAPQGTPPAHRQFLRGRSTTSGSSTAKQLDLARRQQTTMLAQPRASILTAAWTSVGPNQVASTQFGNVTGRVTAIAIDPADLTGNTVYVGTTGGGIWKSVNAAGPSAAVTFLPLTDTMTIFDAGSQTVPSLSIGSLAIDNGVLLAGTGDPNDATDSYYGAGILRSADGGITWTLAQQSNDGVAPNHAFFGLSVGGIAFSSLSPSTAVAAMSQAAEGVIVGVPGSEMGLYYTSDAGLTWHMATLQDGSLTVQSPDTSSASTVGNAVTSVVWNSVRQIFIAAVRYHGYYTSPDGITWSRMAVQPGAGLTKTACPPNLGTTGSPSCPIFRGVLAVQPTTGDTFVLTVDSGNNDQGLYQDQCAISGSSCGNSVLSFGTKLNASPLQQGSSGMIPQADYNLALAAAPLATDTVLYVGTIDLYRCSLAAGCALRNTTNAEDGCTNPAMVAPAQHVIATLAQTSGPLLYLGNDGGLWRSTDGVNETAPPCSLDDANHFQNLNAGLGSLAEVVSFAQLPTSNTTLLAGLGALGTAGTSTATNPWVQLAAGEGGTVAIDQASPLLWYLSTGAGVQIASCSQGASCTAASFLATTIGSAQVSYDPSAIHAPWLLDPGLSSNILAGTCRAWRGPVSGGSLWSSANNISRPFGTPAASACGSTSPVVRSLSAGGAIGASSSPQNAGSEVIYAGLAGSVDGGQGFGGHVFVATSANLASNTTAWTDAAHSPVTNDTTNAGVFNPGSYDISSVTADPHDATGATVYATVMGFGNSVTSTPHLYRSIDSGAHWANISANLPDAPANSVVVDPNDANTLYVALDTGIYVTTQVTTCTSSNCWSAYGTALPNSPVIQLQAAAAMPTGDGRTGELRAATYGRGIWQIPLLTAATAAAPAITINPSTVTYTAQQVGTVSQTVTITITNTGTAVLDVSSVLTTGDFTETDTCVGTPVVQNATCIVQVTFLPTAAGTRTGLLTVYANISGGQATATLSGTATPGAAIVLTPSTLTFPATNVGATSSTQAVTVSNTGGTSTMLQTPIITGDFSITANSCGTTLAPSTGCTLSIAFAPTASGTRTGTLTITDSVGTQVAALSGTATNPATDALAPIALTFALQQLSTISSSQQVTLTNSGDVALTLISAQITAGDFTEVNKCGNSLAAHSVCAITVTFSPTNVGLQAGSLSISDQFRTQTVTLTGTGLAGPGVSLSPTSGLSFGAIGVGLNSPAQTLTLTNNGGAPLVISSINVTGDYNLLAGSNTCGASLTPGAVCTVQVVFAPTTSGTRTGSVTFADSATGSPQVAQLVGTGIDFTLAANGPSSITIASGQTATYALLITSANGLPGSATFTCAGVPVHSTCTVNPATTSMGGTTNISVTVATGLSSAVIQPPTLPWNRQLIWLAMLVPLGIVSRRIKPRWPALTLFLLTVITGCSAGRTIPGSSSPVATVYVTPGGTYPLVVAGSSAGVVHAVNLTLVVQ